MSTVISVENLSKTYRLGQIGTGTLTNDLKVWLARLQGKPNPLLKIGQEDHGNRAGETIWALKDVSFGVEQGEVLGIIGRNGAGKSTLLKILSRVTAPTSGCVKVKGRIASLLEVGTGFHPELTGRENIYLNGAILGMTQDEVRRRFDEIVAFAEIEKFIDTPVKRYSSGMYVRLAFSVAAHLENEIMIIDEILAVGDSQFQQKCLSKMGDAATHGRTVLFVSHNLLSVRNLCNTGLLLNEGKVQLIDEIDDVISSYNLMLSSNLEINKDPSHVNAAILDHTGTGEAKIRWIELLDSKGTPTIDIGMDEEFTIKFGIENPYRLSLDYSIEIYDKNNYPLFHIDGNHDEVIINDIQDDGNHQIVMATISNLMLYPDIYYVNIWLGSHAHRIDKIDRCLQINIYKDQNIKHNLYNNKGRIYKTAKWIIFQ